MHLPQGGVMSCHKETADEKGTFRMRHAGNNDSSRECIR